MGPGGIIKGSYDPKYLTQEQRNWLYGQFGHGGDASVGYGGEHVDGDYGMNYQDLGGGKWGLNSAQAMQGAAEWAQKKQLEANQPAIASLNQHKTDLDAKYETLLSSIGVSEGVAGDSAKLAANNELGRRGIASSSGLGEKEIAASLLPVSSQFGQLKANTGVQRQNDLTGLAQQIAQLQAGNVPNALNFANSTESLRLQAEQIANSYKLGQEQNSIARNNSQQAAGNPYMSIGEGNTLIDTRTGQPVYTAAKTYKQTSSNLGGDWG